MSSTTELLRLPSQGTVPKLLLTVEEAADAMSLGRTLMYELVKDREVLSVKVGRTRRIPVFALEDYVKRLAHIERGA